MLKQFLISVFFSIIIQLPIYGQLPKMQRFDGPETPLADSLFNAGEFREALNEYHQLLADYPQEPTFHYKLGITYLFGTRNIDQAVKHLSFASTREVPNAVYYFLGYAHQLNYNFETAIDYYRRFTINEAELNVTQEYIEYLLSQCESGEFMLKYIYQPKVLDKKVVSADEMHQFVVTQSNSGSFIAKPSDLATSTDTKERNKSYVFFPKNPKPGDKLVYSSYGSTTSFGKDLYIIEMLESGHWSKPVDLGDNINTKFDEDFPYLAPDGVTLYFASKGHYSMGGYDIYRSIFNPSVKQWSTPENLGFPFSSPFNDFLFVPNDEENLAVFFTDRLSENSDSLAIVLVELDENPIRQTIDSKQLVKDISMLSIAASKGKENIPESSKTPKGTPKPMAKQKAASFSDVENDPEYARALAMGFSEQIKADSLRIKLEALRERFDYVTTAEQRVALEKRVVAVEDSLLAAQRNADIQFAKASKIEQEYLVGKRKPANRPQSTFTTDKPDFLYQAQYATTVFQNDELAKLARVEALSPKIEAQRAEVLRLQEQANTNADKTSGQVASPDLIAKMNTFSKTLAQHVEVKKRLYTECISVAMMKAGANGNSEVKRETDIAKNHFRSATAIRNNVDEEHKVESEYEALLLDEIGVLRLELAFAKLWGIRLFEQQTLSKVLKLEKIAFGEHFVSTQNQPNSSAVGNTSQIENVQNAEGLTISRVETVNETSLASNIEFAPERESSFQILKGDDYYNNTTDIPPHLPLPDGVIYKIQLAAFSKSVGIDIFKGMFPLWAEPVNGGKITKYYAGKFFYLTDAEQALPTVRANGFKDAFIVAWHNGRSVQLSRAQSLENDVKSLPNENSINISIEPESNLYVIQIGEYPGKLPDEITHTVRTLAPGKDIVRKPNPKGGFTYSVGSFSNASEADRIKDNIVASGIKSAFVIVVDTDN